MMKLRIALCPALIVSGILFGCSTTRQDSGSVHDTRAVELPIRFAGYRELYTFIAQHTDGGMPTNNDALFKLAADSKTEIITLEDERMPYVYLVEGHYYNGGVYDQIRGAQGNGGYYILRPLATNLSELNTDKGFELVGIAKGNSC